MKKLFRQNSKIGSFGMAIVILVVVIFLLPLGCQQTSSSSSSKNANNNNTQRTINTNELELNKQISPTEISQTNNQSSKPIPVELSYPDFIANLNDYIGCTGTISGRITNVSGWARSENMHVAIFWNTEEKHGEVVIIRIPRDIYKKSLTKGRTFTGVCTLEGFDDNGHPQFVCSSYDGTE